MKKLLALFAASLLLLAACAGEDSPSASDDPKAALTDALRALAEADGLTQTLRLQSDTDSLVAAGEGDIDEDTAGKILDSSVSISATQADNPEDATSQILVNIAGNDDLEVRFVDGNLYFRADVESLLETFGQDPAQLDAALAQVEGQPGLEWVQDAAAGDWVVLEDVLELSEQMGGPAGAGALGAEQQEKLVNDLLNSVEQNATVTSEGEDDAGEHIRATLPLRETLTDLIDALGPAAQLPGQDLEGQLDEVPNEDIGLDFWVNDGMVTQIGFDLVEFASSIESSSEEDLPEGIEELSVIVEIEEFDGEIEAVSDASKIDTAALGQLFTGMMGGGLPSTGSGSGSGGGTGAFDCDMLKGAPPEVIELYAEECPELQ
jgi:hypothetical protein